MFTTHSPKTYPTGLTINYAGKIEGPWQVNNNTLIYNTSEIPSSLSISGNFIDIDTVITDGAFSILTLSGRENSSCIVSVTTYNKLFTWTKKIAIPTSGTYKLVSDRSLYNKVNMYKSQLTSDSIIISISEISSQADLEFVFDITKDTLQGYAVL